jgi:hypothetical protein
MATHEKISIRPGATTRSRAFDEIATDPELGDRRVATTG